MTRKFTIASKQRKPTSSSASSTISSAARSSTATPWSPHAYQKRAIKFLLEHGAAGLFLDPGLGKTSITLAALKILKKEKTFKRALIIAPLRVCYSVWPKETQKWTDFHGLRCSILHGEHKRMRAQDDAEIYLINPEGLEWLIESGTLEKLNCDTLIVDESSKFKHTRTQRYALLKPQLKNFRRRWILTGSPTPNGLLDLFGQIYILDLGASLSPYITQYRRMFFDPTGYGGYQFKLKPDGAERINKAIKPIVLRLEAADYLELPERVDNVINIELPADARKAYNQMERVLMTALAKGEIVSAANAGVATMKCRQIANGGLYRGIDIDNPIVKADAWAHMHMAKVEAVADLVEEMEGQPVLIAYEFEQDLHRLLKVLGKDTPVLGGGVSAKAGARIERDWNEGNLPVLLGHPQSMAHGLNLQGAGNAIIWHSLTWNYENYDQFIKRVHRQGNTHKKVFVHHIIARNTIDEVMLLTLQNKGKVQHNFLTALKDYAKGKAL